MLFDISCKSFTFSPRYRASNLIHPRELCNTISAIVQTSPCDRYECEVGRGVLLLPLLGATDSTFVRFFLDGSFFFTRVTLIGSGVGVRRSSSPASYSWKNGVKLPVAGGAVLVLSGTGGGVATCFGVLPEELVGISPPLSIV